MTNRLLGTLISSGWYLILRDLLRIWCIIWHRVRARRYWPKMSRYVVEYISHSLGKNNELPLEKWTSYSRLKGIVEKVEMARSFETIMPYLDGKGDADDDDEECCNSFSFDASPLALDLRICWVLRRSFGMSNGNSVIGKINNCFDSKGKFIYYI